MASRLTKLPSPSRPIPNEIAFADPVDPDRVNSLVMALRARVLLVVTTERGSRTRIITARKATDHEQRTYEAG
jgi:uncharacterized DUF497 family protein